MWVACAVPGRSGRLASALGESNAVPQIVIGGLVLAAVTSLPNGVVAIYLAAQ